MEQVSRKKMARAVVKLLASHPVVDVAAAVAPELVARRWTRDSELLVQDVATELWRETGQALVTVKSARALPAAVVSRIEELLKERLGAKTMSIDAIVDPTLKGGIIATTPVGVFDVSVAGRLHQLIQL